MQWLARLLCLMLSLGGLPEAGHAGAPSVGAIDENNTVPEILASSEKPASPVWSVDSVRLGPSVSAATSGKHTAIPQQSHVLQWSGARWPSWGLFSPRGMIDCAGNQQVFPEMSCPNGHIQAELITAHSQVTLDYPVAAFYNAITGRWRVTLNHSDGGQWRLEYAHNSAAEARVNDWPVPELLRWFGMDTASFVDVLTGFLNAHWQVMPVDSKSWLRGDFSLRKINWESAQGDWVLADVDISAASVVAPGHHVSGTKDKKWRIRFTHGQITAGEALLGDFYFDWQQQPLDWSLEVWLTATGHVEKMQGSVGVDGVFILDFHAVNLNKKGKPKNGFIRFQVDSLERLNTLYLKDFLALKGWADARFFGKMHGELHWRDNQWHKADISLSDVDMTVKTKKLATKALSGELHWRAFKPVPPSWLHWRQMMLAGLPVQAAGLGFFFAGDSLRFPDRTTLPVFDGALVIDHLFMSRLFSAAIDVDFSGRIEPISLALITAKMGWPVMQGTLSGIIPGMHKKGEQIAFDGTIDISVFGGQLKVSHLSMERLFGVAPVIAADIAFDKLNLQNITTTFDFGEITGLVAGTVNGLRITNWKTDRMDAEIHSVKSPGVKQTLSQKALDRISSLGGVQGAISRSFLRFFKRFRYHRLGLRCRLRQEVCEMGGIRPFKGGYLLVEGGGLPRVNIIGYQRFIDWEEFLDRLLNRDYTDAQVE